MVLVATQVKRRRGTNNENDAFAGAEGEITVDLTNKELRVHTGDNKAGGYGLARKGFENITDEAKNISNWSSNVSNCITNIPQDIKLELNNGTLTLKAGSKVYVPNGAGVFDEITIASDLSRALPASSDDYFYFYKYDGSVDRLPVSYCFSGATAPTSQQYMLWYDTTNNAVKYTNNTGGSWTSGNSLPFCITDNQTVRQVFNGFGYIGSTVFALPGVKGLIPNGRNADGSLKNTEFVFNSVITSTDTSNYNDVIYLVSDGTDINRRSYEGYDYDRYRNIITYNGTQENKACIGLCYRKSGKVSQLYSKPAFHSLDRSETDFIASQAMPHTGRYIDLTLGASGTSYTAPADGWFSYYHNGISTSVFYVSNGLYGYSARGDSGIVNYNTIQVKKGATVVLAYNGASGVRLLRFVYSVGSAL